MVEPVLEPVVVVVVVLEPVKEILLIQTIVLTVIMTVSFIFIIIPLFVIVIVRLSTFLVNLNFAALQNARSAVTIRELQTEGVPDAALLAVVNNNNRVGEGSFPIDTGNALDLTGHGIDYRVRGNLRALDLHTIVVVI